jgi:hypothetical protein
MEVLTAAVLLAWLLLVLLAFAMAGLLRQVRDLQAALTRQRGTATRSGLPVSIRPSAGHAYAAVLLVDDGCPICARVAPAFARLAHGAPADIDFVLLRRSNSLAWEPPEGVRLVADQAAHHRLDPGWQPAVVVLDADGDVLATEPAGSEEAVRAVVETIAGLRLPTG